jgi:hypothetical protein
MTFDLSAFISPQVSYAMSNSGSTPPQSSSSGSWQWYLRVTPLVYEGSGPLERDRASRVAVLDSNASRQGKAIAGFEASAKLAAELFRAPWAWNNLVPLFCLAACDNAGVAGLWDPEDECLVNDFCRGLVDFAALRAVATMLLVEFMAIDILYIREGADRKIKIKLW